MATKEGILKGAFVTGMHGVAVADENGVPLLQRKNVYQFVVEAPIGEEATAFNEFMAKLLEVAPASDHPIDVEIRVKRNPLITVPALEVRKR